VCVRLYECFSSVVISSLIDFSLKEESTKTGDYDDDADDDDGNDDLTEMRA
jgi:hypothetical protein